MTRAVYFAHAMVDYDTARESLAAHAIEAFYRCVLHWHGATVINPNSPEHHAAHDAMVAAGHGNPFVYWEELAVSGDSLAFMCMPGKRRPIGSGVAKEVDRALERGLPVYEVCRRSLALARQSTNAADLGDLRSRYMSVGDTKLVTHMLMEWRQSR